MAKYSRTRNISLPADKMFSVITAVEEWPNILSEVRRVKVTERGVDDDGVEHFVAKLGVAFGPMKMEIPLHVTIDPMLQRFTARSTEQPFRILSIAWELEPRNKKSCRSLFDGEVALSNRLMAAAVDAVGVDGLFRKGAACFVNYALKLHGAEQPAAPDKAPAAQR